MMKQATLQLVTGNTRGSCFLYSLDEFRAEALGRPDWSLLPEVAPWVRTLLFWARRLALSARLPPFGRLVCRSDWYFAMVMDVSTIDRHVLPYLTFSTPRKILYLFDAWEHKHDQVEQVVREFGIDTLLVSAAQVVTALRDRLPEVQVAWIPEGIHASEYLSVMSDAKDIDVLHYGRDFESYRRQILPICKRNGYRYLYSEPHSSKRLPNKRDLINALSRAKVSICVPRSRTHPELACGISTLTLRYLQAMASKCLPLGSIPDDARTLFDYEPVVTIDPRSPAAQLVEILSRYGDYHDLIERNYREVHLRHTWTARIDQILETVLARSENETKGS